MEALTPTEEQIMKIIWQIGHCTVRDIINQIGDENTPHSTISSVVRLLEKKGYVGHKAYGKTYEYYPLVQKENFTKTNLKSMIKDYFNSSPKQMLSFLIEQEKLNQKDIDELMQKLESFKK